MTIENPFVVACIPAFNEEKNMAKVVLKALRHADEVIMCDDGSADMTAEIAGKFDADVMKHKRNMGYGTLYAAYSARQES